MSVKKIFTILIGTIVLIAVSSAIIEVFNINVVSQQLKQLIRTSAEQSCELFTQESYKRTTHSTYSANMPAILNADNTEYISGDFYEDGSSTVIYDSIYKDSQSDFKKICEMPLVNGAFAYTHVSMNNNNKTVKYNLKYVSPSVRSAAYNIYESSNRYTLSSAFQNLNNLYYSAYKPWVARYVANHGSLYNKSQALKALDMTDDLVTPTNIGFPFLDATTINKVFQWNLTQLLTKGYANTIQGTGANQYVLYNGFRCYTSQAFITELDYYIIDTVGDKSSQAKTYLRDYINIDDVTELNQQGTAAGNENNYIVIVGIKYTMPVEYDGITPAKQIFAYIFSKEVKGLDSSKDGVSDHTVSLNGTNGGEITNNEKINDGGVLNTFGELYFTLIR